MLNGGNQGGNHTAEIQIKVLFLSLHTSNIYRFDIFQIDVINYNNRYSNIHETI